MEMYTAEALDISSAANRGCWTFVLHDPGGKLQAFLSYIASRKSPFAPNN